MKNVKAITDAETVALMAVALRAVHMRYYFLWEIGVITGLRISDLLTLRPSSISEFGNFSVRESKTGNWRSFELCFKMLTFLLGYIKLYSLKPDDFLFFSHEKRKHKPMSRQWAHRIIALTARLKGLDSIGAHSMRKIYACQQFTNVGSVIAVQELLGHKSLSTTLVYLQDLLKTPERIKP